MLLCKPIEKCYDTTLIYGTFVLSNGLKGLSSPIGMYKLLKGETAVYNMRRGLHDNEYET